MSSRFIYTDLDFSFLEMNPFTLVNGESCPLDMRGELDDTAAFKNFKKWGDIFSSSLWKSSESYRKLHSLTR
ncbi:hypothetical protein CsSME_00020748 [Camellia sinensis var. sinensis]